MVDDACPAGTQEILDCLPAHIAIVRHDGEIRFVNQAWKNFAQQTGDWARAKTQPNYLDVCREAAYHGDDSASVALAGIKSVLDGTKPRFRMEYPCDTPGESRWFLMEVTPMPVDGSVLISHSDITDQKKTETALRYYENMAQGTPDLLAFVDSNQVFRAANSAYLSVWRLSPSEVIGRHIRDVVGAAAYDQVIGPRLTHCLQGHDVNYETWIETAGLGRRCLHAHYRPYTNENGSVSGALITVRDITDQVREQENARQLEHQMQKTEKMEALGVLAGGIAHDFNNLLAAIYGNLEIAEPHTDGIARTRIQASRRTLDRAKSLAGQLLTFSRGGEPALRPTDVHALIRRTALFASSGARAKLDFDLPDDLWNSICDPNQIERVIENIVINAVQAVQPGGAIHISARNLSLNSDPGIGSGDFVKISIADNGQGIQADRIERVFDPFFTTKQSGSGLGLTAAYSIIQRHRGKIQVESAVNHGTVFHVYLPASREPAEPARDAGGPGETFNGGVILLLDDEEDLLEVLSLQLQELGLTTITAARGEDLLAKAALLETPVAAAILDLTIPGGKGGRDIVPDLRRMFPDCPIFVSSGYSEDPILARPRDFGFAASISKPYTKSELAELLARFLR